jgi:hypothetical protein
MKSIVRTAPGLLLHILFLPAFCGILYAEPLTNSNRQQDYKAYSLGIFRGKYIGFFKFYVPGNNRFSQVPYPPEMLSFVKFCLLPDALF